VLCWVAVLSIVSRCTALGCIVMQLAALFCSVFIWFNWIAVFCCVAACCCTLHFMLQCVAMRCILLQCGVVRVAVQCFALRYSILRCGSLCYSVLKCVAVCCSVLQCVAVKTPRGWKAMQYESMGSPWGLDWGEEVEQKDKGIKRKHPYLCVCVHLWESKTEWERECVRHLCYACMYLYICIFTLVNMYGVLYIRMYICIYESLWYVHTYAYICIYMKGPISRSWIFMYRVIFHTHRPHPICTSLFAYR